MTMTTDPGNRSASQIERDVEAERVRVSETLEALRHRMSPGQVVDQMLDYARESGGGDFARNLGKSIRDNPLPVLLIGAGVGWLVASGGRQNGKAAHPRTSVPMPPEPVPGRVGDGLGHDTSTSSHRTGSGMMHGVTSATGSASRKASDLGAKASDLGAKASETADRAGRSASEMGARASDAASRAGHSISEMASDVYEKAGSAAHRVSEAATSAGDYAARRLHKARDGASHAGEYARNASEYAQRGWSHLAEEQPLVLGAIGFALGAALGAGLPSTRTEDRYLGHASDSIKGQARNMASEHYEHAKEVAGETYDEVIEDLDKRGYSAQGAKEAASAVGGKVRSAVDEIADEARDDMKSAKDTASARTASSGPGRENSSSAATSSASASAAAKPGDTSASATGRDTGSQKAGVTGTVKPPGKSI